jgi:glycosyltransferase involved in cell wall biosynthesis
MSQEWPFVSVVVPTYNRASVLRRCLEALTAQEYPGRLEIIVVDDGSTDGTPQVVEEFASRGVRYLRQANRGPAAARNRGIFAAGGEIIAFTDDDCLPPPDWVSRLVQGYLEHPEVAGVGGYLAPPAEMRDNPIAQYERSLGREVYGAGEEEIVAGFDCPAGGTANMSYRRQVLEEVGGFDESFLYAAGEDADLKWRICQRGARLLYVPVPVTHLQPYTWEAFRRQQYTRGRGAVHFEWKRQGHPPGYGRLLLRLIKRLLQTVPDLLSPAHRRLAHVRFLARWYDLLGQWAEVRRLRRRGIR